MHQFDEQGPLDFGERETGDYWEDPAGKRLGSPTTARTAARHPTKMVVQPSLADRIRMQRTRPTVGKRNPAPR